MNIYTKKQVKCSVCGKFIGEVDENSFLVSPLCGKCHRKEKQIMRQNLDKVLVPINMLKKSTNRVLDVALYLNKHLGSSITIMQVIPIIPMINASFDTNVKKQLYNDVEESIMNAKQYCESKNVVVKHKISEGIEAEEIVKFGKRYKYDLIILGNSQKNKFNELIFGNTSNYVIRNSVVPVLVVNESSPKLGTKIRSKK